MPVLAVVTAEAPKLEVMKGLESDSSDPDCNRMPLMQAAYFLHLVLLRVLVVVCHGFELELGVVAAVVAEHVPGIEIWPRMRTRMTTSRPYPYL